MADIITARYEAGHLHPLQQTDLEEGQTVRLQVVPPRVQVTAANARRRVNRFLLDEVSYLMGSEQPTLVGEERLIWRVPVVLTSPSRGIVGQVGTVDVDAESGDLLLKPDTVQALTDHAHTLATRSPR